ncbi:helix-turn-helix domain-containing protein [Halalkalicoccus salilacus]|uniref:helix-turn-helix domain-containing protein n=1 Tax=Halalkalicoccus TaxID=332246 RepID=UPI002F9677DD
MEAARTAYHSGFFESPRACSGEAVADALGISPSAFYQLNRASQRELFGALFDGTFTIEP